MVAPMPTMSPGSPATGSDPGIDFARLQEMWRSTAPPQPIYPNWFKKPNRPNAQRVHEIAIRRFDELSEWRMAVRHDLLVLRGAVEGIFENDIDDWMAGYIDDWSSPALIDEFNLAVSWLSGLQRRFVKPLTDQRLAYETRTVELAAKWLHQVEAMQYADELEMDVALLEPKILLAYGRIWKRRVLNRNAEPYESPFSIAYIDPAQVVAVKDAHGIGQIYRVYSARVEDLVASYGDFAPGVVKELERQVGDLDDVTEFTDVVEYWDRWYRCVTIGGTEIVPMTEHRLGEVPYTPGVGSLGEPMLTVLPEQSAGTAMNIETIRANAPHKAVTFIRYMKKQHAQYEAMMKRNLYTLQLGNNPPIMRGRSTNAAQNPAEEPVARPGAQNEYLLNEEKIDPFPYPNRLGFDQGALMDALMRDRLTGRAPLSAYGVFDQSNISGTATKLGISAGTHLWKPWAAELDRFVARDTMKAFRFWQRLGHTVEYANANRRPFVVPNERPMKGEPGSFELSRECLRKVGPAIQVRSDSVEWADPVKWQSVKLAAEAGVPRSEIFDRMLSFTYDAQTWEEWVEEQSLAIAMQNPKFVELSLIPNMFAREMDEAQDDPDRLKLLQVLLQGWMQAVVQPAMLEQQTQMGAMQQQIGQQQGMIAPTSQQSFSEQGRGPGSVSGQQGGPQGPVGPRGGGQG